MGVGVGWVLDYCRHVINFGNIMWRAGDATHDSTTLPDATDAVSYIP